MTFSIDGPDIGENGRTVSVTKRYPVDLTTKLLIYSLKQEGDNFRKVTEVKYEFIFHFRFEERY